MDWEDIFKTAFAIITSIGGAGGIIYALSNWFGKVWADRMIEKVKHQYAKELESYKSDLEKLSNEHRFALEQLSNEHRIRFEKLHQRRAEVIEELYAKLITADNSFQSLIRVGQVVGEPSLTEKYRSFINAYNSYVDFYYQNKIYFSSSICSIVEDINKELLSSTRGISMFPIDWSEVMHHSDEMIKERFKFWERARDSYDKKVTKLKAELENNFRILLGVET